MYDLFSTRRSRAWVERIERERLTQERFLAAQAAAKRQHMRPHGHRQHQQQHLQQQAAGAAGAAPQARQIPEQGKPGEGNEGAGLDEGACSKAGNLAPSRAACVALSPGAPQQRTGAAAAAALSQLSKRSAAAAARGSAVTRATAVSRSTALTRTAAAASRPAGSFVASTSMATATTTCTTVRAASRDCTCPLLAPAHGTVFVLYDARLTAAWDLPLRNARHRGSDCAPQATPLHCSCPSPPPPHTHKNLPARPSNAQALVSRLQHLEEQLQAEQTRRRELEARVQAAHTARGGTPPAPSGSG